MKAIFIQQHGPVDGLTVSEIPRPARKDGEVLLEVEAAGINPSDVASFQGKFPGAVLPRVVGRDFAGRVVEGPTELVGLEVWGTGGDLGISRDGTHAEYLAIPQRAVARRPASLSPEQAAVVGVPFVTAFAALFRLGQLKRGEWVIVSGAAGAVGQAACQLAKARGASVIALTRSKNEASTLGAIDALAQSDENNLESVVREATQGRGADLALNGVGSNIMAPLFLALAEQGRQVVYSAVGGREFPLDILSLYRRQQALLGLNTATFDTIQCAEILNEMAPLFDSGAVGPSAIVERIPLSRAGEAYKKVASGKSGKIVLTIHPDSARSSG